MFKRSFGIIVAIVLMSLILEFCHGSYEVTASNQQSNAQVRQQQSTG